MYSDKICQSFCSDRVSCYNSGIKGKYYDEHRIMFVLHRSDSRAIKEYEHAINSLDLHAGIEDPYVYALRKSDTGRLLRWLTSYCGMTEDDVYITNLFKCLIPEDKEPRMDEYKACAGLLRDQVLEHKPRKILVFGGKPFHYMFPEISKTNTFESMISHEELYMDTPSLILNHPRRLHGLKGLERQEYFVKIRNFLKK